MSHIPADAKRRPGESLRLGFSHPFIVRQRTFTNDLYSQCPLTTRCLDICNSSPESCPNSLTTSTATYFRTRSNSRCLILAQCSISIPGPLALQSLPLWGLDPAHQITQLHSLPKFHALRDFMRPMTGGNDLVTMEGKEWKTWRDLFSPGFSSGHLMTLVPEIMKDLSTFCEVLRELARKPDIILMDPLATKLSLDIIGRVTL